MSSNGANDALAGPAVRPRAERGGDMAADDAKGGAGAAWADLGPRVASALVLIPLALAAALAGGPWLAGAAGAAVVVMSYEWARMSAPQTLRRVGTPIFIGAFGAVVAASWNQPAWAEAWLLVWASLAAGLAPGGSARLDAFFGAYYIGAPPAAFVWLRGHESTGLMIVMTLFIVIWCVDMAAYFAGRLIGGPKFAPAISPNKTWAGVIGGLAAGCAAGVACGYGWGGPLGLWALVGLGLAALGLVGDLIESALKRRFGVKDASRIIPGHGGMLDRLDGLIMATLGAGVLAAVAPEVLTLLSGQGPLGG